MNKKYICSRVPSAQGSTEDTLGSADYIMNNTVPEHSNSWPCHHRGPFIISHLMATITSFFEKLWTETHLF